MVCRREFQRRLEDAGNRRNPICDLTEFGFVFDIGDSFALGWNSDWVPTLADKFSWKNRVGRDTRHPDILAALGDWVEPFDSFSRSVFGLDERSLSRSFSRSGGNHRPICSCQCICSSHPSQHFRFHFSSIRTSRTDVRVSP